MNPDVFITIAFVGIVVLVTLVSLVIVLPQVGRERAAVRRSESSRRSTGNAKSDAAVH